VKANTLSAKPGAADKLVDKIQLAIQDHFEVHTVITSAA
jgi:hypothetical protein